MAKLIPNSTLIWREDLASDLCVIRVRSNDGNVPSFEPGQFATLGLPQDDDTQLRGEPDRHTAEATSAAMAHGHHTDGATVASGALSNRTSSIRRAYSIASAATCRDYLEFCITLVSEGCFTPKLWPLQPGDSIWVDPRVHGRFTLAEVPPSADVLMVATGTGIAPFVSMLRTHIGQGRWRRVAVLHGVRRAVDLAYRAELQEMASRHAEFTYIPTVTREQERVWTGQRGRVTQLLEPATIPTLVSWPMDPQLVHIMLCGNPLMINDVERLLQPSGFHSARAQSGEAANLHFERYW